jgi:4-alpha-glucanotransferase
MTSLQRSAGLILHPTSLPGPGPAGVVSGADPHQAGDAARRFAAFLQSAGLRWWQMLPVGPSTDGSPYAAISAFAGDPRLLAPETETAVGGEALDAFRAGNAHWLHDYALFVALRRRLRGLPWWEWPAPLAHRDEAALRRVRAALAPELEALEVEQAAFQRGWSLLRRACVEHGVGLIGDLPIYVAWDSADVWANQGLFDLDERGFPYVVSGVPPDYFSETGQRWGNPVYRWDVLARDDYRWWCQRMARMLSLFDVVRIDHFRAFESFWAVPAEHETAIHGQWRKGPGLAFFDALRRQLGELPLIAEDLGMITADVLALRDAAGLPGMRVLQFGYDRDPRNPHRPENFEEHCVAYPGTHDNDTVRGWYEHVDEATRERFDAAVPERAGGGVGGGEEPAALRMVRAAWESRAVLALAQVQDVLDLGADARMNVPGVAQGNWGWRLAEGALTAEHAAWLRRLGEESGRV